MKIIKQKINNKNYVGYFSKPLKNVWKNKKKHFLKKEEIMDLEIEEILKDEAITRKYPVLSNID